MYSDLNNVNNGLRFSSNSEAYAVHCESPEAENILVFPAGDDFAHGLVHWWIVIQSGQDLWAFGVY